MALFRKESLDALKERIDLVEVVGSVVELKPAGSAYKALCPFHDEKTPSFTIQRGDKHYHCFGCGAHGDAIQFLMGSQQLSFTDAVERLGQQFGVHLEKTEEKEGSGISKEQLKRALDTACSCYQEILLHTPEGHEALHYLYKRGCDHDFIERFRLGYAPKDRHFMRKFLSHQRIPTEVAKEAGLLTASGEGKLRDFFSERITIPICDAMGSVIGFSARKIREETFGGKYINTQETPLFKKWNVLFGLHHSRKRIAKEKQALVVEGQLDALRLIQEGFDNVVASQGTAFGSGHVEQLVQLGVRRVFLAFDGDNAGQAATTKVGDLFQKRGIEVSIVELPQGEDPDSILKKCGANAFKKRLAESKPYLPFLIDFYGKEFDRSTPAGKNQLVAKVANIIREWDDKVMVYESLKQLARLTGLPEQVVGVGEEPLPNVHYRRTDRVGMSDVDPDFILETDLLRWLITSSGTNTQLLALIRANISPEQLKHSGCQQLLKAAWQLLDTEGKCDVSSLAGVVGEGEALVVLDTLFKRKVNLDKRTEQLEETIERLLTREWMMRREELLLKIKAEEGNEERSLQLAREFQELKNAKPALKRPPPSLL